MELQEIKEKMTVIKDALGCNFIGYIGNDSIYLYNVEPDGITFRDSTIGWSRTLRLWKDLSKEFSVHSSKLQYQSYFLSARKYCEASDQTGTVRVC